MRNGSFLAFVILAVGLGPATGDGADVPKISPLQRTPIAGARPPVVKLPDLRIETPFLAKYVPPGALTRYERLTQNPNWGEKIYLVCPFTNESDGPVSGDWKMGFYVDGKQVAVTKFGAIPAHHRQDPATQWVVEGGGLGLHAYMCKLDFENTVTESNETNNDGWTLFMIQNAKSASNPTRTPTPIVRPRPDFPSIPPH